MGSQKYTLLVVAAVLTLEARIRTPRFHKYIGGNAMNGATRTDRKWWVGVGGGTSGAV